MVLQTYNASIAKWVKETPWVKTYVLDLGGEIDFLPGQFVMVELLKKLPGVKRAYSISSSPMEKKTVSITIKKEGVFSSAIDAAPVGEELVVRGPIGHFILDEKVKKDIVFIAGGTGVAPFRSMIYYVLQKKLPNRMTLFYSCKTPDEFVYYKEMDALQKDHPQLTVIFTATRCTDHAWKGLCERINPKMLTRTVENYKECIYYICGPQPMVESMQAMLQEMSIDKKMIKVEKWG